MADVTVPLLVTIPNATSACPMSTPSGAAGGWPVAIVQHGITRQPLAGARDGGRASPTRASSSRRSTCRCTASPTRPARCIALPTKPQCIGATERTFNVDLVNNTTGAAVADGVIDSSGTHFINLTSPLTEPRQPAARRGGPDHAHEVDPDARDRSGHAAASGSGRREPDARSASSGMSLGAIVGAAHVALRRRPGAPRRCRSPGGVLTQAAARFGRPSARASAAGVSCAGPCVTRTPTTCSSATSRR